MPSKKPSPKGGKKAAKSTTKPAKAKPAAKKAAAKAPAKKADKKPEAKPKVTKPNGSDAAAAAVKATPAPAPAAKKAKAEKKPVVPWAERFKDDAPGPWTCPKCGALPQRAQPLYGEDERHHCPNLECDQVVTLLSKEDLEPAEKRGSWPPQRNKNRALPGGHPGHPGHPGGHGGEGHPGGPPPGPPGD